MDKQGLDKVQQLGIFDLIEIIFSKIIIIIVLGIIFFLSTFFYVKSYKVQEVFVENYQIHSLGATESVPVKILNDLILNLLNKDLIKQTLELGDIDLAKYYDKEIKIDPITPNFLLESLYKKMISQQILELMDDNYKFVPGIEHKMMESEIGNLKTIHINFTYSGSEKEFIENNKGIYSIEFIKLAKQLLAEDIHINIKYAINASEIAKDRIILQLKEQNNQLEEQYKFHLIERIYDLKEQALIARELGIKSHDDITSKERIEQNETIVEFRQYGTSESESNNLDYLRGHIAIEKEIQLLENRKEVNPYVPQIHANLVAIRILSKKDFINEDEMLDSIGLSNNMPEFLLVKEHKSNSFRQSSFNFHGLNKNRFVLFFTIFGSLLGVLYALIDYAYRRHKNSRT